MVVDRLTKMTHFAHAKTENDPNGTDALDTKAAGRLYIDYVFQHHGAPEYIVNDWGGQFISELAQAMMTLQKIKHQASTAYRPESDGQTKRINVFLEQYL